MPESGNEPPPFVKGVTSFYLPFGIFGGENLFLPSCPVDVKNEKGLLLRAVARAGEIVSLLFSFLSVKKLEKGKYLGSFLISVRRTPARLSEAVG